MTTKVQISDLVSAVREKIEQFQKNPDHTYDLFFEKVTQHILNGDFFPWDLGLSEHKYYELRKKSGKLFAIKCLEVLRAGQGDDYYDFNRFKFALRLHRITIEELETIQEELDKLEHDYWRKKTEDALEKMRDENNIFHIKKLSFDYYRRMAHLTLEDLGTSKEELKEMEKKSQRSFCLKCLSHLRNNDRDPNYDLDSLLNFMEKGGFTPEDIGTTKAELLKFRYPYL